MIPPRFPKERPSTYVVQDRMNKKEELQRLKLQDRMITDVLGGVLPEQSDVTPIHSVLDVACGAGGWLVELTKTYSTITQLVGVDISKQMINAAREEAENQQVQDRVAFHVMDALDLSWAENSFDLTNMRFALSFLRTWEWPQALQQLWRVARPGGIIRVTEADLPHHSSSPTLQRLFHLLAQAYQEAGKYFRPQAYGISDDLATLLVQQGLHNVQAKVYRPEVRGGTAHGQLFFEDMKYLFRTNLPFLLKWTKVPTNYEDLYRQMLQEMQQPDFVATNQTVTAWGYKGPIESSSTS